jgi:hypothetical protein
MTDRETSSKNNIKKTTKEWKEFSNDSHTTWKTHSDHFLSFDDSEKAEGII